MNKFDTKSETQDMKHLIDLPEYASQFYGFVITKKSTKKNIVLTDGKDKFLFIKREDGWLFKSTTNSHQKGNIINFVMNFSGLTFKEAKDKIRGDMGWPNPFSKNSDSVMKKHHENIIQLREKVQTEEPVVDYSKRPEEWKNIFRRYTKKHDSTKALAYFQLRGVDGEKLLADNRFHFRENKYGSACFLVIRPEDLNIGGIEAIGINSQSGEKLKLYYKGTNKGFVFSGDFLGEEPKDLIINESKLDCISYAQLIGDLGNSKSNKNYLSIGGQMSEEQEKAIRKFIGHKLTGKVIIALDDDQAGNAFTEKLVAIAKELNKDYQIEFPFSKDWNNDLMLQNDLSDEDITLENLNAVQDSAEEIIAGRSVKGVLEDLVKKSEIGLCATMQ